ncbi:MAG: chemotaxis protein CheB [Pseudomonadales bacterium]
MATASVPTIGIVCDSPRHITAIRAVMESAGCGPAFILVPGPELEALVAQADVDVWFLSLSPAFEQFDELAALFDNSTTVILDENSGRGSNDLTRWAMKCLGKIEGLVVGLSVKRLQVKAKPVVVQPKSLPGLVKNVWVLGASTGGPEAVIEFLQAIPADLPIAFVYSQHNDPRFVKVLVDALNRNTAFEVRQLEHGDSLKHGQVGVVPADGEMLFLTMGRCSRSGRPWAGVFSPAINQVVDELSLLYKEKAGVIIFSGMGDDGASACSRAKANGTRIWAQAPESSLSSSMPDAAIATGEVDVVASPLQLAQRLIAEYGAANVLRG